MKKFRKTKQSDKTEQTNKVQSSDGTERSTKSHKTKISRKGKIIIIIMAAVIALLIGGTIGLYFLKNKEVNSQKNDLRSTQKQLSDAKQQLSDMKKQLTDTKSQLDTANKQIDGLQSQITTLQNVVNSAPQYFVLADWGVKFLLPTGLKSGQIQYSINGDTVNFTTAEVAALGGYCKLDIAGSTPLGSITRSQNWDNVPGVYITNLNGYYYFYLSPQATCSRNNVDLQTQDVAKIRNLLFGILVN